MFQIELEKPSVLRGIITQGKNGLGKQWTEEYKVMYSKDCKTWETLDNDKARITQARTSTG